jgi:large subunit ribosomal protein L25
VNVRKLKIKALPDHLPDDIEVKVDDIDIGQHVRVGELSLQNVQILDEPNKVVAAVRITRQVAAAQNEAAGGKKK